jgi:hypothetical protein
LWVRDDLDGYGAMITWDVADGIPELASVTIVHNGRPSPVLPPMPVWGAPGAEWLAWGHARDAFRATAQYAGPPRYPDGDVLLLTLRIGLTSEHARAKLADIDVGHVPHIIRTLKNVRRMAGDQWLRELEDDDPYSTRPSTTLDRNRAVWPHPDAETIRADSEAIKADLAAIDDLQATFARLVESDRPADILKDLPAQTSKVTHVVQTALADGPTRRNWKTDHQNGTIVHRRPGERGQVTVVDDRTDVQELFGRAFLNHALDLTGTYGVAVVDVLVGMIRDDLQRSGAGRLTLALDDLAKRVGLRQRTQAERINARARIFSIVRTLAALWIAVPNTKKVRVDGRLVDMSFFAPLILLQHVGCVPRRQLVLDGFGMAWEPFEIQFCGSDALLQHARLGNHALEVLGSTARRDAIPGGQASGSWARAIVAAVQRLCRINARYTVTERRERLLTMYTGEPHLDNVLKDRRTARRAVTYWSDAIKILQTLDGGPMFQTIDDPTAPAGHGWALEWRRQVVTLRVHPEALEVRGLEAVIAGRKRRDQTPRPALPRPGRPSTRRARAD